jgi:hypothetical protein
MHDVELDEYLARADRVGILRGLQFGWGGGRRSEVRRVAAGSVFYHVYVRSFADSNGDGHGNLPNLTRKLDYITP